MKGENMGLVNGLQVNVEMRESAEDLDDQERTDYDEGYETGFMEGWCQAACQALENMYDRYRDREWARELLYPGLEVEAEGLAALIDELMDEYAKEVRERESEQGIDAFDETAYNLGRRGEDAACRYLRSKGYTVIARNWECPYGEADIIAEDVDGTVCFIEVKTRRGEGTGVPEEAVTADKRRRYENIALSYMGGDGECFDGYVRFDAIGILVNGSNHALLRHHVGYMNDVR